MHFLCVQGIEMSLGGGGGGGPELCLKPPLELALVPSMYDLSLPVGGNKELKADQCDPLSSRGLKILPAVKGRGREKLGESLGTRSNLVACHLQSILQEEVLNRMSKPWNCKEACLRRRLQSQHQFGDSELNAGKQPFKIAGNAYLIARWFGGP